MSKEAGGLDANGVYRGVVLSCAGVENAPHRIMVSVPQVTGDEGVWALPCWPYPPGGVDVAPAEGDGVWIVFEGGRFQYPVYLGFFGGARTVRVRGS